MRHFRNETEFSPLDAFQLKILMEKETLAKAGVYEALKNGGIAAVYAKKREYENCCIHLWLFNQRFGIAPSVKVNIPDTDKC
jgi:hypothetical protein